MNAKELKTKEIYDLWKNSLEGEFLKDMTPRKQIFPNMIFMLWISSSSELKSFSPILYLNSGTRGKKKRTEKKREGVEQGNT